MGAKIIYGHSQNKTGLGGPTHRHIVPGLFTMAARSIIGNRKREQILNTVLSSYIILLMVKSLYLSTNRIMRKKDRTVFTICFLSIPYYASCAHRELSRYHMSMFLPHLPYSPNLAPSSFHLFGPLKDGLRGIKFGCNEKVNIIRTMGKVSVIGDYAEV